MLTHAHDQPMLAHIDPHPTLPDAVAMAPGRSGGTITDVYLTRRR
jgi:hypothetical protein